MSWSRRAFTPIESLIATAILTSGLVAVAWLFVYSSRTNQTNQERTLATLLLQEKLEQLKATPVKDAAWSPGEYSDHPGRFVRTWQIRGGSLRTLTVIVYAERSGLTNRVLELARANAMAAP